MSVEELFNLEPDERDELFCEKEDWTSEEIDKIIDKINYGQNIDEDILLGSTASHPETSMKHLESFALSGKYGSGMIISVLLNDNCSEEILRGVYNKSSDDQIYTYTKMDNVGEYGKDGWEKYKTNIIEKVNGFVLKHSNCPDDLKRS